MHQITKVQGAGLIAAGLLLFLIIGALVELRQARRSGFPAVMTAGKRRSCRRQFAIATALFIGVTSLGGWRGVVEPPWRADWALSWEQTVGDWTLFGICCLVVVVLLVAVAVGPETEVGGWVRFWLQQRRKLRKERDLVLGTLAVGLPNIERATLQRLWRSGGGMSTAAVEMLALHTAERPLRVPALGLLRARVMERHVPKDLALQPARALPSTFRETALHEAGHAMALTALDGLPVYVQVFEPGRGETVWGARRDARQDPRTDYVHVPARMAWKRMVVSIAGQAAEFHGLTTGFRGGALDDWRQVIEHANALYLAEARLDGASVAGGPAGWVSAAFEEATRIVDANYATIKAVADELVSRESGGAAGLSSMDLQRLMQDVSPVMASRVTSRWH